jgi:hypothetical protein
VEEVPKKKFDAAADQTMAAAVADQTSEQPPTGQPFNKNFGRFGKMRTRKIRSAFCVYLHQHLKSCPRRQAIAVALYSVQDQSTFDRGSFLANLEDANAYNLYFYSAIVVK